MSGTARRYKPGGVGGVHVHWFGLACVWRAGVHGSIKTSYGEVFVQT